MTDIVEVAGGTVTVAASTSGVSVDDPDCGAVVVGPDGTTVTVDPAVDVVTAGGGTTVVATGTTAIQVVEAGGGGGVSDHGALSGLGDDDHTQYLLVDGSRNVDGDLTVTGVVPSYWTFTNSPRTYGGVDYYNAGDLSVYVAVRNISGDWVDTAMADDGTTTTTVPQWVSSWSGLYVHLCDVTGGGGKFTVVSNMIWSMVDSHFDDVIGPGMITADVADVTGWTYSDAPTYEWTDSTGLAVCAPSGSTAWPDPATMTATILPKLQVLQVGGTAIAGDVVVTGDLHVGGGFYPRLVESGSEPSMPGTIVWHDTTLDEWWLIVDLGGGSKRVQLT